MDQNHQPLHLIESESIPPDPNKSPVTGSTIIDFLPNFSGYSWISYGASSLLVISHFPSFLSPTHLHVTPFFRQVITLSPSSSFVAAVSWSPAATSSASLAAAVDNRLFIFDYDSSPGSFCWSQTALLIQCSNVESIAWTNSGDGIVSVGTDIVLWKRNLKSWEIAWKFRTKVPQTLISTTWSLEGPSATSAYPTQLHTNRPSTTTNCSTSYCVNVYHYDGTSGYISAELRHPQPVFAIQWRPSGGSQTNKAALYVPRHVLLTSCLDGTARLWSEVDGNRVRNGTRDSHDAPTSRRLFCVVAVIEVNHSLNGTLGTDIFITWALDLEGLVCVGDKQLFSTERHQNDEIGRCEWLIGLGPGKFLTFWAVHCLDDIATMRSPRVTLWQRQELLDSGIKQSCSTVHLKSTEVSKLTKAIIWRNQYSGPPAVCSLVQLSACNSLAWSVIYNLSLVHMEQIPSHMRETDDKLFCQSRGILDTLGHTGKILQVAVHPFLREAQLAISLDSDGGLLLWSISTSSYSISGLPSFTPSWQLTGKITLQDNLFQGMSLNWAPLCLGEDLILLVGHIRGIDVHIIKPSEVKGQDTICHKLCTIPFIGHDHVNGPDKIASFPLDSTCKDSSSFDSFLLLGVWMTSFRAESWKVTLRCYESSGSSCQCDSDINKDSEGCKWVYKTELAGKIYCLAVNICSSHFPNGCDEVTSMSVVSPSSLVSSLPQTSAVVEDFYPNKCSFHFVTGHSDGSSRIWRIKMSEALEACIPFELVGRLSSFGGTVNAVSVADWGQKIATICSTGHENTLYIWEPHHVSGGGTFEVEDNVVLNGEVLALHWLVIENMLFLGICFQNELHIYCRRVYRVLTSASETQIWVCIAIVRSSTTIRDFLLGPNGMILVIHARHFSLFSPWAFLTGNTDLSGGHASLNSALSLQKEMDRNSLLSSARKICLCEELPSEKTTEGIMFFMPLTETSSFPVEAETQPTVTSRNANYFVKITEVAEKICGPLPFYHPDALLMNIYSGNWKRANVAVCHLIECLVSDSTSEQRLIHAKSSITIRQVNLLNYLEGQTSNSKTSQVFQWSADPTTTMSSSNLESGLMQFAASDATNSIFTASMSSSKSSGFHEALEKLCVQEAFKDAQKIQMFAIVDLLREINNSQYGSTFESLDEPGRRFWCAIRLQQLEFHIRHSKKPSLDELVVDSQLMGWAFHSDCHMNLFDAFLPTEPTWEDMRKIGVGFWLTNLTDLRTKMEKLARCQYLKKRDPKACSLLYIALNRVQVLTGLFKISKDEKDKPLVAFLSRNFQEEKHKAAASKNAYVLMGRHQFALAVAFFLLGGDIVSAITVCAKNLGDGQLALVICRLVEGQNGPSERHLISNILLPSAIEKGDYWLTSILEWLLGNYLQSFLSVLGLRGYSYGTEPEKSNHPAFLDPSIGQFCLALATKNSLRNVLGEMNTALISQWAIVKTASAFNRCGLPLEALECLSTPVGNVADADNGTVHENSNVLPRTFGHSQADSSRWLSNEVSSGLAYQIKLDLAMQYVAKLIRDYPGCDTTGFASTEPRSLEHDRFEQMLGSAFSCLEQKFNLMKNVLLDKVFASLDNSRQHIRYNLLRGSASQVHFASSSHAIGSSFQLFNHLAKDAEKLSYLLSRFVTAGSVATSHLLVSPESSLLNKNPYCCFQYVEFYMTGFLSSMGSLTTALMFRNTCTEDLIGQFFITIDLCKCCMYFTSALLQRNDEALAAMLQPILNLCTDGNHGEIDVSSLNIVLREVLEALSPKSSGASTYADNLVTQEVSPAIGDDKRIVIPEDERHMILGSSLWKHMCKFIECQLNDLRNNLTPRSSNVFTEPADDGFPELVRRVMTIFIDEMRNTVTHISFHTAMQLASFFWHKTRSGNSVPTLVWLEEFNQSKLRVFPEHPAGNLRSSEAMNLETVLSSSEILAKICDDPKPISELLAQLPIKLSEFIQWNPIKGWNHFHLGAMDEHERLESYKQEGMFDNSPRSGGDKSPSAQKLLDSDTKGTTLIKEIAPFHGPREIYRRNGELLEALSINSIEQRQAVVASNKKGITFFDWGHGVPLKASSDFIWAAADWPQKGWAGMESTPTSTCVTPVGFGINKGSSLGFGGATVGHSSQVRLGKELNGGGAFGIPDYGGIGVAGMSWGIRDDFDKFIDPPATLDNINARALASHPSRPYFLAGSGNSHIYLWEFGEGKASATYGVPAAAANISPPYALASATAVQFDCSGQRFSNCASDGTVCTWQLEVGGRSNVKPTDSSVCFNGHASDICYVATSGSIIASAGYSSNSVNVVIWDTLAPPTSSRASVMCHEGGACSISVFDNDVGTGSISPLIITGGKGGDVGLHDFRYIATGKTKRHKHSNALERATDTASIDVQHSSSVGDQNRHGMLWYIPKAHSGSVTKISTIPNTSFFLTGGRDGDVKLWDAKRACLVYHWPKLHERHTFLQRGSQSFGGVTRVGVTDIQVVSDGFLTCGGDGSVKLVELNNFSY